MDKNEVLDYILKRYNINKRKLRSQRTSIADTNYAGYAIMELEKLLKHFKVKYEPL
jgi:hypothetical protein